MEIGRPHDPSQYPPGETGYSVQHYRPKVAEEKRRELSKADIFLHIIDSLSGLVRRV